MPLNKHNLSKLPKEPKVHKSWFRGLFGRSRSNGSTAGSSQDSRTAGWIGSHGSRSSYEASPVSTNLSSYAYESRFRPIENSRPSVAAPPLPLGPPSSVSGYAPPQRPLRPPTKASLPSISQNSAQDLNALKTSVIALKNVTFIGNLKQRPEDSRECLGRIEGSSIIPASRLDPEYVAHLQNILRPAAASASGGRDVVFRYEGESRGMQLSDPRGGKVKVVLNFKIRWYAAPRVILAVRAVELKEVGTTRATPSFNDPPAGVPGGPPATKTLNITKRPAAIIDPLTAQIRAWRVLASIKQHGTPMKGWQGTLIGLQVHRGTKRSTEALQEALKGYTVYYRYDPKLTPKEGEPMLVLECSLTWDDREKKVFAERIRAHRT